jgi:hypothetical protein
VGHFAYQIRQFTVSVKIFEVNDEKRKRVCITDSSGK